MRHGRPLRVKDHHHHGASQLGDIILLAAITKTLSTSGTRNLPDPHTLTLSEPLLLQILRAQSLHPSTPPKNSTSSNGALSRITSNTRRAPTPTFSAPPPAPDSSTRSLNCFTP
ncbi:hypothetical protein TB1_001038 [Malus domestica]